MGFMDYFGMHSGAGSGDLEKIEPMLQQKFGPYEQQGQEAYGKMNPIYSQMGQDPAAFMEQMMGKYRQSSGFQNRRDEALRAAGNSAAAGGMRGSGQDVQNSGRLADSLMNDDMQQWIQNLMGVQDRGMQGLGNFYEKGYDATKSHASDLSNLWGTQSQRAFQSQQNENKGISDFMSALIQAGGMVGGGMAMGGKKPPMGYPSTFM